ncbi:MAG: 2,3-bisphosphoglycerate-independent phosphoglycerate mutase [Syntrophales bacterium]
MNPELIDTLIVRNSTKIVFLIMDGLGGLPIPGREGTELETARTPNLDRLAMSSVCGLLDPVGPGITPGSGPAHFALFGYDPITNNIGRGLLEAAGIDYPMTKKDLLVRINFATIDRDGFVIDRRAGRISNETNKRICKKLQENIRRESGIEVFFEPVKEHRAVLVLRGEGLHEEIQETDPQKTGLKPLPPLALIPQAQATAKIISNILEKAGRILRDEEKANMLLLRGYSRYRQYPSIRERFGLDACAIAGYPMYRGISRLLGMSVAPPADSIRDEIAVLRDSYTKFDFFFVHVKPTDSRGEDGDFDAKVKVIEEVDSLIPLVTGLEPDVLVITGDHSTPAALASHSWHPVPVILHSKTCRPDRVERFGERDCLYGGLGRMPMVYLMGLALAHARRLEKFGA